MHPRDGKFIRNSDKKNLKDRDHMEDHSIDKRIINKMDLKKHVGFIWLWIGTCGMLL
jgi:hypothetical protein